MIIHPETQSKTDKNTNNNKKGELLVLFWMLWELDTCMFAGWIVNKTSFQKGVPKPGSNAILGGLGIEKWDLWRIVNWGDGIDVTNIVLEHRDTVWKRCPWE